MPEHRYTAPTAKLAEDADALAGQPKPRRHGLGRGVSLLWRVILLHMLFLKPVEVALQEIGFFDMGLSILLRPFFLLGTMAGALAVSLFLSRHGLLWLLWGGRLNMSVGNWHQFTWGLCGVYALLAAIHGLRVAAQLWFPDIYGAWSVPELWWIQGTVLILVLACLLIPCLFIQAETPPDRAAG